MGEAGVLLYEEGLNSSQGGGSFLLHTIAVVGQKQLSFPFAIFCLVCTGFM